MAFLVLAPLFLAFPAAAPTADFTVGPSAPEVGEVITLDASASNDPDGRDITGYLWFFGDGDFSTTGPVVSHSYAMAGAYSVMLTVTNNVGASGSITKTIVVGPTDIVRTPGVHAGEWARYSFEGNHPDVSDIVGFSFLVQDVTGSSAMLMVTVTFRNGTDNSMESEVDVAKLSSTMFLLIGSGLSVGDQVYADAAYRVNATALELVLGKNREATTLNTTRTIPGPVSTYTQVRWDRLSGVLVYQNITSQQNGNKESTVITIVETNIWAPNQPPVAGFSFGPSSPVTGQTVSFDAGESSDPDGPITSYSWDFGDGETATGAIVSHGYTSTGTFTVTLTVTDDYGAIDSVSRTITISSPTQQAPSVPSSYSVYIGVAAAAVLILGGVFVYVWRTRARTGSNQQGLT